MAIWQADHQQPCMLELDAFGALVLLTFLMPFALCNTYDVSIYSKNYKTSSTGPNVARDDEDAPDRMSIQPPIGSVLDHHNLRLTYTIHVYQLIVSKESLDEFLLPHNDTCNCQTEMESKCLIPEEVWATRFGASSNEILRSLVGYLWCKPRESIGEEDPVSVGFHAIKTHLDCDKLWEEISKKT